MQSGPSGERRKSNGSRLSRLRNQSQRRLEEESGSDESYITRSRSVTGSANRFGSSPSKLSYSSSLSQQTPARSYFQCPVHGSLAPIDATHAYSQGVRNDTAELASLALSDVMSIHSQSPTRQRALSATNTTQLCSGSYDSTRFEQNQLGHHDSDEISRPGVIEEISEPASPDNMLPVQKSNPTSALTKLIRNSSSVKEDQDDALTEEEDALDTCGIQPVIVGNGIISQPSEQTLLLPKKIARDYDRSDNLNSMHDLESQKSQAISAIFKVPIKIAHLKDRGNFLIQRMLNLSSWNRQSIWKYGFRQPISYIPPVMLGLLLNILDALSYGMILFPLGQPIFASLGPDGISMFYIEVVPFFHKMALTILARVGEENPKSVLATTILSYSLSSVMTGLVFFIMGKFKLGSLVGFFPRHILIGCIGGVGWFLVATGLEVSARLGGSLEYTLPTLEKLTQLDTIFLWTVPLTLSVILLLAKRWVKHPLLDAIYFISIIASFYIIVAAIPDLNLPELRSKGWVFEAPKAGVPFYHFYTLYDFGAVDWEAIVLTVPAMLSLTFFGILHVPINVPALGLTAGEDNVDIDRELRAHGISNVLSGLCGSIQNYLVYTNTVLFIRSGGDNRFAGMMLAMATFGVLVVGPIIIGFIPIMVVGALIFYLGFDLLGEALFNTWGRVHRIEYLTIVIIIVTMGAWDFVIGILVGILLACVSFVLQTSQISAIRGSLHGGIANSTVRRHPIQHHFLQKAGRQIYVMKLAGYLFFGTIVGVEKRIRELLHGEADAEQFRFLVLDFYNVDRVDFSAAEAFTRINRVLRAKDVTLVFCGITIDSEVGKSLYNVGLFDTDTIDSAGSFFKTLNSALEYCENHLLKAFHEQQQEKLTAKSSNYKTHHIPRKGSLNSDHVQSGGSPRQHHLLRAATTTLSEVDSAPLQRWQDYGQPLRLILQTFSSVSDQPEDFWRRCTRFFVRKEYAAGGKLYGRGDPPDGFYLLETGILKAEYELEQGRFSELIVAGTTCGELPFFSNTSRTSTTVAERDCVVWVLDEQNWAGLQTSQPDIAQELLKIGLKLTSERMNAITKYMLLTSG